MTYKVFILNKPIQYKKMPVYGVFAGAESEGICQWIATDMIKEAVVQNEWQSNTQYTQNWCQNNGAKQVEIGGETWSFLSDDGNIYKSGTEKHPHEFSVDYNLFDTMNLAMAEVVGYLPLCYDFIDDYLVNEECYRLAKENSVRLEWLDVVNGSVDIEDLPFEAYRVRTTNRKQIASYDEYASRQSKEKKFEDVAATKHIIVGCAEFAKLNEKKKHTK